MVAKAAEFLRVVTGPQCSPEEFACRMAACQSNACGHLKTADGKVYCGACGCPKWKLAELHTKLWFKRLECPADPQRWQAVNEPDD